MNIELRSSGGRGEFELAGRHGDIHVSDVQKMAILLEILPGIEIQSFSWCVQVDGKPRIRLIKKAINAHPATLIASAMMLPKPKREMARIHGEHLLGWERFAVRTVRVDVEKRVGSVIFRPVTVRLENGDGKRLDIDFADRMARVLRVWVAARTQTTPIADKIRDHARAFTSIESTQTQLSTAIIGLYKALDAPEGDLLPQIEACLGIGAGGDPGNFDYSGADGMGIPEDVHSDPLMERIERVRRFRLAAIRSGSALSFRRTVQDAYNSTCVFSGQQLPKTDATKTPGVDAAHILPWSRYDLDLIQNGLCLNKQCHWAFDEGIIRLRYDETVNSYVATIPNHFRAAAETTPFDIGYFERLAGPIPISRLPKNTAEWSSQQFIAELNVYLDSGAA